MIERAVLFCDATSYPSRIYRPRSRSSDARPSRDAAPSQSNIGGAESPDGLKEQVKAAMSRLERELIQKALDQTNGNVTHAARLLKISRKGLQLKMKELGLREKDDRPDA